MKNKFLNVSIGVGIMLLCAGFFVRSITTANAAPKPEVFLDEGSNHIGKYMMQVFISSAGGRYAMVWNTETGKSKAYFYNGRSWDADDALPDNPMGE